MAIPRKKVLEKIEGKRKPILRHPDRRIPDLIDQANEGLVEYWRKEVGRLIDEMEGWANRLSSNASIVAEAVEYRRRLNEMLDNRLHELDD